MNRKTFLKLIGVLPSAVFAPKLLGETNNDSERIYLRSYVYDKNFIPTLVEVSYSTRYRNRPNVERMAVKRLAYMMSQKGKQAFVYIRVDKEKMLNGTWFVYDLKNL